MTTKLNILFVHGAWADGSQWQHILPALHAMGHRVIAIQNPLTSLADDVERTIKLTTALYGPTLLVGHSYGGMVITQVGHLQNVVGMVYLAAFAPDAGESLSTLFALRKASVGAAYIRPDDNGFLWIDTDKFHENMCHDVDENEALVMALVQKPLAARAFTDKSAQPAWRVKPCWYQVSTEDRMLPVETQREFAERIQAQKVIELPASHASHISHPQQIIALIADAANAVR
ncbi:alpha/beta hydrolase [Yersinia mollaretii]|uniref:Alpha/beta hydrolase n=1 Tax=Yersinia mollaretii TaxID=33060 RepID=A0AA44CHS2_YERMO|nr:alpha/beta hydrolase [Yersinia mollaretii]NIL20962.1 alpha/beta hydrolase [Yersinia mollaretii]CNI46000.1 putative signal peptide protein [Yersinia mollaretii]CNL24270.1 putative signal peptide protein [Yersinia enterocolitica]CQQ38217.1 putative signal peptide protein [Yersinia mollaretii]